MKLPDEPRPVPAGTSAMEVISMLLSSILEQPQHLADNRVLHLARLRDSFDLGIANDEFLNECPVDRDVDGLVDGRRYQEPTELPVVGR